jgi:hypothetical protein
VEFAEESMARLLAHRSVLLLGFALLFMLGWKGEGGHSVRTIAEVLEKAEQGDRVTVEGEVTDFRDGHGSLRLATLDDGTGEVIVAVPEHLRRSIEREPGESARGVRFRVSGTWDHGYLDQDRYGIRADSVERLPE